MGYYKLYRHNHDRRSPPKTLPTPARQKSGTFENKRPNGSPKAKTKLSTAPIDQGQMIQGHDPLCTPEMPRYSESCVTTVAEMILWHGRRVEEKDNTTFESRTYTRKADTDYNASMYIATAKLAPMDQSTDVNFEVPPNEVAFFSKQTYIVLETVALSKYVMHPTTCLVDMGQETNQVNDAYSRPQWRIRIQKMPTPSSEQGRNKWFPSPELFTLLCKREIFRSAHGFEWLKVRQ